MQSPNPLLQYSTTTGRDGERAVRSVSAIMVGLSTAIGCMEGAMFYISHSASVARANAYYFRGHEELVRYDTIVNGFAAGFLIFGAIVYLLRKSFVIPLLVGSMLLVAARVLDGVCYGVGPYRGTDGWLLYYMITWLISLVGIRVMIPLANVVWFTRPAVRAAMAARARK